MHLPLRLLSIRRRSCLLAALPSLPLLPDPARATDAPLREAAAGWAGMSCRVCGKAMTDPGAPR